MTQNRYAYTADDVIPLLVCPDHDILVHKVTQQEAENLRIEHGCWAHNAELAARRDPQYMTIDDRCAEVQELLDSPMWTGLHVTIERVEALVGRPVRTSEMAYPDTLTAEMRKALAS